MNNLVVQQVFNVKSGTSRVVALVGQYTVTIERTGKFPDDMILRPDDTIDIQLSYDPRG